MKFEHLQGSVVAMITPFHEDGSVNFEVLTNLLERQIAAGTDGILTLGTTGEYSTMSHEEDAAVVEHTIRVVDGRVPVMVGSGSNCTATQVEKSIQYQDMGADALLLIAPYYNKANQKGMYRHFATVAEAVDLPIILYNVPGRTGLDIAPETIDRLAESGRFVALKESSYDLPRVMEKISAMRGRLTLYSGNDDMIYPLLALGAEGVISVLANVAPAYVSGMTGAYFSGKTEKALTMQTECLPLVRALFSEVSPIPCKYAMELLGLCGGELRLPLIGAGENTRRKLREALVQMGILIA